MKIKVFGLLCIMMIVLFSNCKKDKDYREDYIGNYHFNMKITTYNFPDSTKKDTTTHFNGEITLGNGPEYISIHYNENRTVSAVVLSNEGKLYLPALSGHGIQLNGQFENHDNVTVSIAYTGDIYVQYDVTGTKY